MAGELKLRKMTYNDLAKKTGYKKSTITAFMNGYRNSKNVAEKIADALKLKIVYEEKYNVSK